MYLKSGVLLLQMWPYSEMIRPRENTEMKSRTHERTQADNKNLLDASLSIKVLELNIYVAQNDSKVCRVQTMKGNAGSFGFGTLDYLVLIKIKTANSTTAQQRQCRFGCKRVCIKSVL
jgi:hypothetical protein